MIFKNKKKYVLYIIYFILTINCTYISNVKAEEYYNGPSIGLQVGTLGFGFNIITPKYYNFDLRGNINYINISRNINIHNDNIDFNANLNAKLFSLGFLLDYYIFNRNLYVSFGVYNDNNKFMGSVNKINKINFSEDFSHEDEIIMSELLSEAGVQTKLTFNKFDPYIGVGYKYNPIFFSRIQLVSEIGLLYIGKPKIGFTDNNVCTSDDPQYNEWCTSAINQMESSLKDKWQNTLNKINIYPVMYLGIIFNL